MIVARVNFKLKDAGAGLGAMERQHVIFKVDEPFVFRCLWMKPLVIFLKSSAEITPSNSASANCSGIGLIVQEVRVAR